MIPGRSSGPRIAGSPYVDDLTSASAFAGPVLTHSDWTPDNVLVSPDRAWLIDWA